MVPVPLHFQIASGASGLQSLIGDLISCRGPIGRKLKGWSIFVGAGRVVLKVIVGLQRNFAGEAALEIFEGLDRYKGWCWYEGKA